jgi:hypothetical protein
MTLFEIYGKSMRKDIANLERNLNIISQIGKEESNRGVYCRAEAYLEEIIEANRKKRESRTNKILSKIGLVHFPLSAERMSRMEGFVLQNKDYLKRGYEKNALV